MAIVDNSDTLFCKSLIVLLQKLSSKKNKRIRLSLCKLFLNLIVMMKTDKTFFNPLRAKFIKWSNTLKQIVGKLPTICLNVFDHFFGIDV